MKKALIYILASLAAVSCGSKDDYTAFLAGETKGIVLWQVDKKQGPAAADTLARGTQVLVSPKSAVKTEGLRYLPVKYGKRIFYAEEGCLVAEKRSCVVEKELYVQTSASLIDDTLSSHIATLAKKRQKLEI